MLLSDLLELRDVIGRDVSFSRNIASLAGRITSFGEECRMTFLYSVSSLPFEDDNLGVVYATFMIELFFGISEVALPK